MESFTLEQYKQAQCTQLVGNADNKGNPILMALLVRETNGRVCETGCCWLNNGKCEPYKLLISNKPFSTVQPIFTENVKAEALRLGISISETRRRRRGE
jgi:hypothetical protein